MLLNFLQVVALAGFLFSLVYPLRDSEDITLWNGSHQPYLMSPCAVTIVTLGMLIGMAATDTNIHHQSTMVRKCLL